MFKLTVLILFILFMYFVLFGERNAIKITIVSYFTLLSIVFLFGISKISNKYHLYDGPVLERGFQSLGEWVGIFSYLYIIPSLVIIAYVSFKIIKRLFIGTKLIAIVYIVWLTILVAISFISQLIFTLIYYGFAP
ncbi:hypothetical protein SLU01_10170 [Sporosarcina luteola]|uniref:Uncharacterized protein n=1 Tax=Sporosarcina luteola TaxID=582850 RepID=A0A511Z5H9_9BACL|nr:hypothetical protein SLU01_10170 [Sporosarcina luteola]